MAEHVSIWRWAIFDGLEALFVRLIEADDDAFAQIAVEMAQGEGETFTDPEQVYAQTEAKIRAMGLPPAELATTLAGLKAMWEEDMAEIGEASEEIAPEPDGRIGVSLASSHMFYDDPFAALEYEEIARQVSKAMAAYRAAIAKAVGHEGQSMAQYLGLEPNRQFEDAAFDILMDAGLAEIEWLWVTGEHVLFLSQWHEDKELPIDLEFGRAPLAVFEETKAQLVMPHEM